MILPVAGVKAMNSDLSGIAVGDWADLLAEPDNPYDRNAIAVWLHGRRVGYLQREWARSHRADEWEARVAEVLLFEGTPAGLRLDVQRDSTGATIDRLFGSQP